MLRIKNLNKAFGTNQIIKNLSFEAYEGEIIVISGKSGAGKTTLLRIINQLESFDSGSIEVDNTIKKEGDPINKSLQQKIGLVFQNFNLFPHKTVLENCIEAPIYLNLLDKKGAIEKARKLLNELEIAEKENVYPSTLSGGQRQRVAIARACMLEPKVLCFDEPTSALDVNARNQIVKLLKQLSEKGMIILVVSHDLEFIDLLKANIIRLQ